MKTIVLERNPGFDVNNYIRRPCFETDYATLIKEPCKLIDKDTGNMIGIYLIMPKTPTKLLTSILSIKYGKHKRTRGLPTTSRVFGYHPREPIRHNFCASHSLSKEHPKKNKIICDFANDLSNYYKKYCGEVFLDHMQTAQEKILPEWTIRGTPFTSGIINKNNILHYHYDSGNLKNAYSNMVAFKSNITGGHLSIPEYDIGLEIANNSILLFDGQKILHGVTPMRKLNENAYRYTLVYYTLKMMWKCEPLTQEIARIKTVRTDLERRRIQRMKGEIPNTI